MDTSSRDPSEVLKDEGGERSVSHWGRTDTRVLTGERFSETGPRTRSRWSALGRTTSLVRLGDGESGTGRSLIKNFTNVISLPINIPASLPSLPLFHSFPVGDSGQTDRPWSIESSLRSPPVRRNISSKTKDGIHSVHTKQTPGTTPTTQHRVLLFCMSCINLAFRKQDLNSPRRLQEWRNPERSGERVATGLLFGNLKESSVRLSGVVRLG